MLNCWLNELEIKEGLATDANDKSYIWLHFTKGYCTVSFECTCENHRLIILGTIEGRFLRYGEILTDAELELIRQAVNNVSI